MQARRLTRTPTSQPKYVMWCNRRVACVPLVRSWRRGKDLQSAQASSSPHPLACVCSWVFGGKQPCLLRVLGPKTPQHFAPDRSISPILPSCFAPSPFTITIIHPALSVAQGVTPAFLLLLEAPAEYGLALPFLSTFPLTPQTCCTSCLALPRKYKFETSAMHSCSCWVSITFLKPKMTVCSFNFARTYAVCCMLYAERRRTRRASRVSYGPAG